MGWLDAEGIELSRSRKNVIVLEGVLPHVKLYLYNEMCCDLLILELKNGVKQLWDTQDADDDAEYIFM